MRQILIVFSTPEIGGAERSLTRMALRSNSSCFHLSTIGASGNWSNWCEKEGGNPVCFACEEDSIFTSLRRLRKYVLQNDIKIIYVCGARLSLFLRLIRFLLNKPILIHGIRWNPESNSRLDISLMMMEKVTKYLNNYWITNSNIAKRTLVDRIGINQDRVFTIHNGLVDIPTEFKPIKKRPYRVLTVANLNERKGYIQYLQVIKEVKKEFQEVIFTIIGRDDMGGKVQSEINTLGISSCVEYLGFQSDVDKWYKDTRIFVLPSLWNEGCPTSVLEAMAYGIPCVAFAIDGIPELIESEVDGFLHEKGDYKKMVDSILRLLLDEDECEKFGRKGNEKVKNRFSIENTVQKHENLFLEMLGR